MKSKCQLHEIFFRLYANLRHTFTSPYSTQGERAEFLPTKRTT